MAIAAVFLSLHFFLSSSAFALSTEELPPGAFNFTPPQETFIRIEQYARSEETVANYHFYERNGQVICTERTLCTRYLGCHSRYEKGLYMENEDIKAGAPDNKLDPQLINMRAGRKGRRTVECLKPIGIR